MSVSGKSGDVFFNPAYGDSSEFLAGYGHGNVIPLEVVYENTSFKQDDYKNSEFVEKPKKTDEAEDENDIYKSQLMLFLKQNNLLNNSTNAAEGSSSGSVQHTNESRRSSESTNSSVSIQ